MSELFLIWLVISPGRDDREENVSWYCQLWMVYMMAAMSSCPWVCKGHGHRTGPTLCCGRASWMWAGGRADQLTYKLLFFSKSMIRSSLNPSRQSTVSSWLNTRLATKNLKCALNLQKTISKFLHVKPTTPIQDRVSGPGSQLWKAQKLHKGPGFLKPNFTEQKQWFSEFSRGCAKSNYALLYPHSVLIQSLYFLPLLHTTNIFSNTLLYLLEVFTRKRYYYYRFI